MGPTSVEAPDNYPMNHLDVPHITEVMGSPYGPNFVFVIHRDEDGDRDVVNERQRNEVKAYAGSPEEALGRQDESVRYHWYFNIGADYQIEGNSVIFFQLHNLVAGPIVKIQGRGSNLELSYDQDNAGAESAIATHPFDDVRDQWLECEVVTTYSEPNGYLRVNVWDEAGAVVIGFEDANIDMWTIEYTRPKWGIYRARDLGMSNAQDTVGFADFTIQEIAFNR